MKKILSLVALLVVAFTTAWAGDVFTYTLNGSEMSEPAGYFTHDASGKFSFNGKFTGTYDGISFTKGLKMEGTTKILFTTTVESNVTIVQSTWSDKTIKFDDEELAVADAVEEGTGCRVYTLTGVAAGEHTITRGNGESGLFLVKVEYTAEDLTPSLSASPKAITLNASPLGRTRTASFTLTGKNLTDGNYDISVPAVDGLSVEPASVTVSEGTLEQTVTVTYTSEADVEKATADIVTTIDDIVAVVAVTYQSRANAYELTIVSEEKAWNWETLTETVELTDESVPSKNDEFVFKELEDQVKFGSFDAQSILISKTQFPVRSKKFQNGTIKFIANRPGTITVDFSDTGSSGDGVERYLNVNGVNTEYFTKRDGSSDRKTTDEIAVPAGEVAITGCGADGSNTPIQIFKVTFTPTGDVESYEAEIAFDKSRLTGWAFPESVKVGDEISVPYTVSTYDGTLNNVVVTLLVNGKEADKAELGTVAIDEEMGEGSKNGLFTYTAAEAGELNIQLVLKFDGSALNEGENETEVVTILVEEDAVDPVELAALDPTPGLVDVLPTEFVLTYGGKKFTAAEDAEYTLTSGETSYPLYVLQEDEDGNPLTDKAIISFDGKAITTPGEWLVNIPAGAITVEGTKIEQPQSFKYIVKNPVDFTVDPAEGEVESLSTFYITANNYSLEMNEDDVLVYLFNEVTEEEIEPTYVDVIGNNKILVMFDEVTKAGTWQLNIEDGFKNSATGEYVPLLTFTYTIAGGAENVITVDNIDGLNYVEEEGIVMLTLTDAKVTYSWLGEEEDWFTEEMVEVGELVIEDETGGVLISDAALAQVFEKGLLLNGTMPLKVTNDWGVMTFSISDNLDDYTAYGELLFGAEEIEVAPTEITDDNVLDYISSKNWKFVKFNDVTFEVDSDDYYGDQYAMTVPVLGEENEIAVYELLSGIDLAEVMNGVKEETKYTVEGYLFDYSGFGLFFQPVSVVDPTATDIQGVKEQQIDGFVYNLQGVRVEKTQKGLYIVNGKKVVVK